MFTSFYTPPMSLGHSFDVVVVGGGNAALSTCEAGGTIQARRCRCSFGRQIAKSIHRIVERKRRTEMPFSRFVAKDVASRVATLLLIVASFPTSELESVSHNWVISRSETTPINRRPSFRRGSPINVRLIDFNLAILRPRSLRGYCLAPKGAVIGQSDPNETK